MVIFWLKKEIWACINNYVGLRDISNNGFGGKYEEDVSVFGIVVYITEC